MKTIPITVLVDDREKAPYTFTDIELSPLTIDQLDLARMVSATATEVIRYDVTTITQRLYAGDYSLPLLTDRVAVERKSLADLAATLNSEGRAESFAIEMERLSGMEQACVVVEEDWRPLGPLARLVTHWQDRYPRVFWGNPVSPGRRGGELTTFLFLLAFHAHARKEEGITLPR